MRQSSRQRNPTGRTGANRTLLQLGEDFTLLRGVGTKTHTRSTVSWHEDSAGVYQFAAANTEVVEYSGSTILGYRHEPARTNKALWDVLGADQDGSALVTGTDSDMSGAGNWTDAGTLGTLDINSIVPGKMYIVGDGGDDFAALLSKMTLGRVYRLTLKARLNAGASTTINMGRAGGTPGTDTISITPTSTEQEFTGTFVCTNVNCTVGLSAAGGGFNGVAFEIDDVDLVEIGGTKINADGTSAGTFVSGHGAGANNYRTGGAWVNDAIPGVTGSGGTDDQSTITVASDTAAISSGGLSNVCISGKVLHIDNTGAAATMYTDFDDAWADAGTDYVVSVFARGSGTDDIINIGGSVTAGATGNQNLTGSYVRYVDTVATSNAADKLRITTTAGDECWVLLQQPEAGAAITSPKITQDTTTTSSVDTLTIPAAEGKNIRSNKFEISADVTFGYNGADVSTDQWIIGLNDTPDTGIKYDGTNLIFTDGTNNATVAFAPVSGTTYTIKARANKELSKCQVKYDTTASTEATYDGDVSPGATIQFGDSTNDERLWLKNVKITNTDPGTY
jgi:hypothetical protein